MSLLKFIWRICYILTAKISTTHTVLNEKKVSQMKRVMHVDLNSFPVGLKGFINKIITTIYA